MPPKYSRVSNKHPWTFNLNEIFFSTQRQLVILDIYKKKKFPEWDFYWIPTCLIFSWICLTFFNIKKIMKIIYFCFSLSQILEYCETLQIYLVLTCMAYLFLISIFQKCSLPLMIKRFYLFEKKMSKIGQLLAS